MKFITDEPALLVNETLVIGDLHIGIEYELYKSGISLIPKMESMLRRVRKLLDLTGAKKLVILGDLKHNIPETSRQESSEVPEFLGALLKDVKIDLVPGNHDGGIKELLPEGVTLYGSEGFLSDGYYFTHGHTWPSKDICRAETLLMSHIHPAVEFRDSLGFRSVEHCWLTGSVDR
ncbi:MAG: phosphoesterase, partial [Candidatus Aenigmatarchaeota archaeon]